MMLTIIFSVALMILLISIYIDTRNFQTDLLQQIKNIEKVISEIKDKEKTKETNEEPSQEPPQE